MNEDQMLVSILFALHAAQPVVPGVSPSNLGGHPDTHTVIGEGVYRGAPAVLVSPNEWVESGPRTRYGAAASKYEPEKGYEVITEHGPRWLVPASKWEARRAYRLSDRIAAHAEWLASSRVQAAQAAMTPSGYSGIRVNYSYSYS